MNLLKLSEVINDVQPVLSKPEQPLPELWLSVVETDQQKRRDSFLAHAKHIMADMPDTYGYLAGSFSTLTLSARKINSY